MPEKSGRAMIALIASIILVIVCWGVNFWFTPTFIGGVWISCILVLGSVYCCLGCFISHRQRCHGILVDGRNKCSLSRFQVVFWSLIIFPSLATVILLRTFTDVSGILLNPLDLDIPTELWSLMGVSIGTKVGAIRIKRDKDQQGRVYKNVLPDEAKWSDMFKGEEFTDYLHIDIAKVQMFLSTLLIGIGYILTLVSKITADNIYASTFQFPALDDSLVIMLGISQIGYLSSKQISSIETTRPLIIKVTTLGPLYNIHWHGIPNATRYKLEVSTDQVDWDGEVASVEFGTKVQPIGLNLPHGHSFQYVRIVALDGQDRINSEPHSLG